MKGDRPRINWQEIATEMGYEDRTSMLTVMYQHRSLQQMADILGVDRRTISYHLRNLGVEMRDPGGPNYFRHGRYSGDYERRQSGIKRRRNTDWNAVAERHGCLDDRVMLLGLYRYHGLNKIGELLGVSGAAVRRRLLYHKVQIKDKAGRPRSYVPSGRF